ncbi:MAG: peptide deformylase [Solirubrobacterales bacterium]|nr:peptide deformylase [Solirubrobacterales bacterium]
MAVRKVLLYPDPGLKRVCVPAPSGNELSLIVDDLIDTMRSFPGCVGIAAPQIGYFSRVAVIDLSEHRKAPLTVHGLTVLVDPVVVSGEGSEVAREGCLSIPQLTANVRRYVDARVDARDGTLDFEGFEARCVLHEIDHLDGLLFLDRVDSLTQDVFPRKQRK